MKRIDGKQISASLMTDLSEQVGSYLKEYGRVPHLVVIRVGNNLDSVLYVRNKSQACNICGIKNTTIVKEEKITEQELLNLIGTLNEDDTIDGILVQLPLPDHINPSTVIASISPEKDVDGFHPSNVAGLWQKTPHIVPCTPKGIMILLKEVGVDPKGKCAVVIGRSNIVGLPIAKLLLDSDATVVQCHSKTVDLPSFTRKAEILVVAAGKAGLITGDMVSNGVIVIDVGINRDTVTGKICGDVDYNSVEPKASAITPVPGGVGPMTIACLMQNTIECFIKNMKRKKSL